MLTRKKFYSAAAALLIALNTFCACASKKEPEYDFELYATSGSVVLGIGEVTLTVTTKNLGDDYVYFGSSTKVGAIPELYCVIDGKTFTLAYAPVPVTLDYVEVVVKHGEIIQKEWIFFNDGRNNTEVCPGGVYSLKLTYFEFEHIYPVFLVVYDEVRGSTEEIIPDDIIYEDVTDDNVIIF